MSEQGGECTHIGTSGGTSAALRLATGHPRRTAPIPRDKFPEDAEGAPVDAPVCSAVPLFAVGRGERPSPPDGWKTCPSEWHAVSDCSVFGREGGGSSGGAGGLINRSHPELQVSRQWRLSSRRACQLLRPRWICQLLGPSSFLVLRTVPGSPISDASQANGKIQNQLDQETAGSSHCLMS